MARASNQSFTDIQKPVASFYKIFGASPIYQLKGGKVIKLKPKFLIFFVLFLTIYWISILASFFRKDMPNNIISIVSNYVQLILKAMALSTVIINTLYKYRTFHGLMDSVKSIDSQLRDIQQAVDYKSSLKQFLKLVVGFLAVHLYNLVFNFYVNVVRYETQGIPYWIICSIPLLVYSAALHQAIVLLLCCLQRFRMIQELLTDGAARHSVKWMDLSVYPGKCQKPSVGNESLTKFYIIMGQLFLFCDNINDYFGPVFLVSISALFAESSIQAFYCFTIASDFNERKGRSIWTLMTSINVLLINLALVTVLSCVAEMISKEANNVQVNVMELKREQAPCWIHNKLARIRFTALGFFEISYSTLFGFITALLTYLVILIQFYFVSFEEYSKLTHIGVSRPHYL